MSEFPLWSGEIKPSPPYTGEVFLSSGTFSLTGFLDGLPKRDEPPAKVRWVEDEPNLARMVIEPDPSNTDKPPRPKDSRDKIPDLINRLLTAIDAEIAREREACEKRVREAIQAERKACEDIAGGGEGGVLLQVPNRVEDPFAYMVGRGDAAAAIRNRSNP
jgi:hypothetical protein